MFWNYAENRPYGSYRELRVAECVNLLILYKIFKTGEEIRLLNSPK